MVRSDRRIQATHRRTGGRGFSLVELVVVLMVIGLWAAIALPRFGDSIARHRVDAAARRIANDLERARDEARALSTSRTVTFDLDEHSYTLSDLTDPDHSGLEYKVMLAREPYNGRLLSASFGSEPFAQQVTFDGFGLPDLDGVISVSVGNLNRLVLVEAATGRVSIQ